jgi:lysophospholipid acyltransferase (LPLAT)-like uncharacterized protein
MKQKIIGFIASLLIRFIGMTLRYHLHFKNEEEKIYFFKCYNEKKPTVETKYLLAFFHQDELCLLNYFRGRNMSVLISISKDGEIMNNAAVHLGYKPVRGSSSRRAVAGLIAGIKKVKSGYKMAFAVDGPRGPIYKVKDGICVVAKKTETKIIPVRAVASNQKLFEKSWNQAKFPKLFSRIDMHFAPAKIYETQELEDALNALPSEKVKYSF